MIKIKHLTILLLLTWFLSSCELFNKNTKKIDVSHIELDLDIRRFDQVFFADSKDRNDSLYARLVEVREQDADFFDFYVNDVMRFGHISDSLTPTMIDLNHFFNNAYVQGLYDTVQKHYPSPLLFEEELENAFKHFKHYFPNKTIPQVNTIISEFGYNVVALDTTYIAISLDMFLGKEYKYYNSFDFPFYVIRKFEPEYIVPNTMEVIYNAHYGESSFGETKALIHAMIEKGKLLYFKECMQPEKEKHFLIGYTEDQLHWCENEEEEIWKFYNEHDLFYSKNFMDQTKHLKDGPFTAGMPEEAPGNVGSWVGWQIVNSYMKNTPNHVTLKELLSTPADYILNNSKYKP